MSRREYVFVFLLLLLIHVGFYFRGPLPHADLVFYTEPAFQLATTGKLMAPALVHMDVSTPDGFYLYPPGHSVLLAFWLMMWPLSASSLLAYTLVCHFVSLLCLWAVLRIRLGFHVLESLLGIAPFVFIFTHGRPDQTAIMFGMLGWLMCPARLPLAGVFLGLSFLSSPALGLGTAIPAGAAITLATRRLRPPLVLTTWTIASFTLYLCAVLAWQDAWRLAFIQFVTNSAIRGRQLNEFPDLMTPFALRFSLVPLFLCFITIIVLLTRYIVRRQPQHSGPALIAVSNIVGFFCLFLLVKSQLLLWLHFLLPARAGLVAAFCQGATAKYQRVLAVCIAVGLLLSSADWMKHSFQPLSVRPPEPEAFPLPPRGSCVATDSLYYVALRDGYQVLSYDTVCWGYWKSYLQFASRFQWFADRYRNAVPPTPQWLVISSEAVGLHGPPDATRYELTYPTKDSRERRGASKGGSSSRNPYAVSVYRRKADL